MAIAGTSVVSHWSVADIQLTSANVSPQSEASLGETWQLTLAQPNGAQVANVSFVVAENVVDGVIDLEDVAKGLADQIVGATPSGSMIQYSDATGVQANITVTTLALDATVLFSGTYATDWSQGIKFTGGASGASTAGDDWKIVIGGQTWEELASGSGMASIATDFYNARGELTGFTVEDPNGASTLSVSPQQRTGCCCHGL